MSKSELANLYNFSISTLGRLMNKKYYSQLQEVGYCKTDQILSPKVVRRFMELYDKPIKEEEIWEN